MFCKTKLYDDGVGYTTHTPLKLMSFTRKQVKCVLFNIQLNIYMNVSFYTHARILYNY